jgi:hypothetical protein
VSKRYGDAQMQLGITTGTGEACGKRGILPCLKVLTFNERGKTEVKPNFTNNLNTSIDHQFRTLMRC